MDGTTNKRQDRRGRNEVETLPRNAPEQSLDNDALLHPDLRLCLEDSLRPAETLLHRALGLRAEYPRVLLSRGHHRGADFDRTPHVDSRSTPGVAHAANVCAGFRADFCLDPRRLPPGLVHELV